MSNFESIELGQRSQKLCSLLFVKMFHAYKLSKKFMWEVWGLVAKQHEGDILLHVFIITLTFTAS